LRKPLDVRQQVAEHALEIGKDIIVPVADNSNALFGQPLRPAIIGFFRLFGVLSAIHFDGEAERCTIKVDYERSNWMLFSKRKAIELSATQRTP
jgi:hypothetical protein